MLGGGGWRLLEGECFFVYELLGGLLSEGALIREGRLFEGGFYSRGALIREGRLFESGAYSRGLLFKGDAYSRADLNKYGIWYNFCNRFRTREKILGSILNRENQI